MKKLNKICISLLAVLTLLFQVYPASTVRAEDAVASEKLELTAENEQIDSADEEALSMDEPSEEDSSTVADPSENLTYVTFDATISDGVSKEGDKYIWHANSNASGHGVSYRVNYSIIKGTHIADLSITEMVVKQMEQVAAGDDAQKYLDQIEGLIMEDIKKMAENAGFTGYAGKRTGIWKETGKEISFKTEWGGHTFTEEEQDRLLNGETITFTVKKDDAERSYTGKLEKQEYNGHNYVGFKANFAKGSGNSGSSNKANATGMTCPRCGKPINKLTWGYGCSGYSSGCSFRVGNTFNGKKLTDKQIRDLITKGKTSKPLKLVSKAGNEYEAYLVLNGPEEKYPVGMEFANKKR